MQAKYSHYSLRQETGPFKLVKLATYFREIGKNKYPVLVSRFPVVFGLFGSVVYTVSVLGFHRKGYEIGNHFI